MNQAKIITVGGIEQLVLNYDFNYENNRPFSQKGSFILTNRNNVFGVVVNVTNEDENNPCAYVKGEQKNTLKVVANFSNPKYYRMSLGDNLRVMVLNEIDPNYFYDLRNYFQTRLDYYEKDLENENGKISYNDFNSDWNRYNTSLIVNENCDVTQNLVSRGKPKQTIKDIILSIE